LTTFCARFVNYIKTQTNNERVMADKPENTEDKVQNLAVKFAKEYPALASCLGFGALSGGAVASASRHKKAGGVAGFIFGCVGGFIGETAVEKGIEGVKDFGETLNDHAMGNNNKKGQGR
jgi:hypothetical protein